MTQYIVVGSNLPGRQELCHLYVARADVAATFGRKRNQASLNVFDTTEAAFRAAGEDSAKWPGRRCVVIAKTEFFGRSL
ncbi:MAG: hypothetical protein WDN31_02945 [Hyphomicrobium sp.]